MNTRCIPINLLVFVDYVVTIMVTIWNQDWFKFKLSTWTYSMVTSKGTIFKPLILAVWSWKVSWLFDCTKNNSLPYCVLSFPSLLLGLLYFGILYSLRHRWRENAWGHKGSPLLRLHPIPPLSGGEVGEGIWKLSTCMKHIVYRVTEHQCYCN